MQIIYIANSMLCHSLNCYHCLFSILIRPTSIINHFSSFNVESRSKHLSKTDDLVIGLHIIFFGGVRGHRRLFILNLCINWKAMITKTMVCGLNKHNWRFQEPHKNMNYWPVFYVNVGNFNSTVVSSWFGIVHGS